MISKNMISIELEREVATLLNDGKSTEWIAGATGVSEGTIGTIRAQPTLRNLVRKRDYFTDVERKLTGVAKCISCGAHVTDWPCLSCHPNSTIHSAGPLKPEDEGTVVTNGIQMAGRVIMPATQQIVALVRLARNLIEMKRNNLVNESVLIGHLVKDAKAALIITKEDEKNGKQISGGNEGAR